jgi:hypothetical protein
MGGGERERHVYALRPRTPSRRNRRRTREGSFVRIVVAASFARAWTTSASAARAAAAAPRVAGRRPPTERDARLADLVDHVEHERDLDFKYPAPGPVPAHEAVQQGRSRPGRGEPSGQGWPRAGRTSGVVGSDLELTIHRYQRPGRRRKDRSVTGMSIVSRRTGFFDRLTA